MTIQLYTSVKNSYSVRYLIAKVTVGFLKCTGRKNWWWLQTAANFSSLVTAILGHSALASVWHPLVNPTVSTDNWIKSTWTVWNWHNHFRNCWHTWYVHSIVYFIYYSSSNFIFTGILLHIISSESLFRLYTFNPALQQPTETFQNFNKQISHFPLLIFRNSILTFVWFIAHNKLQDWHNKRLLLLMPSHLKVIFPWHTDSCTHIANTYC